MRSTVLRREYSSEEMPSTVKQINACKAGVCDCQVETWRDALPFGAESDPLEGKEGILAGRLTQQL
jgi:hypothetical protein